MEIPFDRQDRKQFKDNKERAKPQNGTANCVKKHDALQAFIRKCLLFSRRCLPEDLIWGKEVIS